MNEKTNYGNWVPEKALYLLFALAAVFLTITVLLRDWYKYLYLP